MKTNRTCLFCGNAYYFCPNCSDRRDPKIYSVYDSEECMKAFNTLVKYNKGIMDDNEAKIILTSLNINPDKIQVEQRREKVKKMLAYSSIPVVEVIEPEIEPEIEVESEVIEVTNDEVTEETVDISVENTVEETPIKKNNYRKRYYKK